MSSGNVPTGTKKGLAAWIRYREGPAPGDIIPGGGPFFASPTGETGDAQDSDKTRFFREGTGKRPKSAKETPRRRSAARNRTEGYE